MNYREKFDKMMGELKDSLGSFKPIDKDELIFSEVTETKSFVPNSKKDLIFNEVNDFNPVVPIANTNFNSQDTFYNINPSDNNLVPVMQNGITDVAVCQEIDDKIDVIIGLDKDCRELERKIKKAEENKEKAKSKADEVASKKYSIFGANKERWGDQRDLDKGLVGAIESIQDVYKKLAETQQNMMAAIKEVAKLGIVNIAANRAAYAKLKMTLHNASGKKLSDNAKQEILSVMEELNRQQDIMMRQEQLSRRVREQDNEISSLKRDNMQVRQHNMRLQEDQEQMMERHEYLKNEVEQLKQEIKNKNPQSQEKPIGDNQISV